MSHRLEHPDYCSIPECNNSIPGSSWDRIKSKGWFFQKDGTIYCPEHVPDWVTAWRNKKENNERRE